MATLTITAKGRVTLKKEILKHLGVKPGDKVEVELKSDQRIELRPLRATKTISDLSGILKGKGNGRKLSIEQMNAAIAEGWVGHRKAI